MRISPRLETSKIDGNWRTLAWQCKVKTTYISIFLGHYRQPWKSHNNLVLAMPPLPQWKTVDHLGHYMALEYSFQGNAIKSTMHIWRQVVWWDVSITPLALPGILQAHKPAILTWNPTIEFLGLKRWLHAAADSISVIRVLWDGWVSSCLNERQEFLDCFGNQSGELHVYKKNPT